MSYSYESGNHSPSQSSPSSESTSIKSYRLFIAGVCESITEKSLRSSFEKFGDLKDVVVIRKRDAKGIAFVEYYSSSHAREALEHYKTHRCCIEGTYMDVMIAMTREEEQNKKSSFSRKRNRDPSSSKDVEQSCAWELWVGNIDNSMSHLQLTYELKSYFSRFGTIQSCTIRSKHAEDQPVKQFAFVRFQTQEQTDHCLETKQHKIRDKILHVRYSETAIRLQREKQPRLQPSKSLYQEQPFHIQPSPQESYNPFIPHVQSVDPSYSHSYPPSGFQTVPSPSPYGYPSGPYGPPQIPAPSPYAYSPPLFYPPQGMSYAPPPSFPPPTPPSSCPPSLLNSIQMLQTLSNKLTQTPSVPSLQYSLPLPPSWSPSTEYTSSIHPSLPTISQESLDRTSSLLRTIQIMKQMPLPLSKESKEQTYPLVPPSSVPLHAIDVLNPVSNQNSNSSSSELYDPFSNYISMPIYSTECSPLNPAYVVPAKIQVPTDYPSDTEDGSPPPPGLFQRVY